MGRVVLQSVAQAELTEAVEWYAARSLQTARRFAVQVDLTMLQIAETPESFPGVSPRLRRAIVPRFPFGIYFITLHGLVVVVGVIHSRRHPRRWLQRE